MSNRRAELRLVLRERRASTEQALLNRAFRANKGVVDRVITRVVAAMVPTVASEPGRSKTVDHVEPVNPGDVVNPGERQRPRRTGPSR